MILWGMGVSQHVHGTDNARCLIALALMTGQIGRPGTGPAPAARAEQRAGRVRRGPDPDDAARLPARRRPACARASSRLGRARSLDAQPGLTVVEILHAIAAGKVRGMYIMGENPAMSDPDVEPRARRAGQRWTPGGAGHLPDRDRLPGRRGAAGQAFPEKTGTFTNTDRRCSWAAGHRPAGRGAAGPVDHPAAGPRLGLDWHYGATADATRCSTRCARPCPASPASPGRGCSAARGHLPLPHEGDPGQPVVFTDHFPRPMARALRAGRHHPAPTSGPTPTTRWC
jgi:formate dehydrogenase major subunit